MAVKKSDLIKAGKYPPKSDKLTKEELKQKFLKKNLQTFVMRHWQLINVQEKLNL